MYLDHEKNTPLIILINRTFENLCDDYIGRHDKFLPLILFYFLAFSLMVLVFMSLGTIAVKATYGYSIFLIIPLDVLILWLSAHVANTSMWHIVKL